MLQTTTVSDNILNLITELQNDPQLKDFVLAGSTALALQLGQRRSIDIDLFSGTDFDAGILL